MKQTSYVKRPFFWSFLVLLFLLYLTGKCILQFTTGDRSDEKQPSQNAERTRTGNRISKFVSFLLCQGTYRQCRCAGRKNQKRH